MAGAYSQAGGGKELVWRLTDERLLQVYGIYKPQNSDFWCPAVSCMAPPKHRASVCAQVPSLSSCVCCAMDRAGPIAHDRDLFALGYAAILREFITFHEHETFWGHEQLR